MSYDGERVSFRAIEPDDLDRYLLWVNDPEVTRWLALRYPIGREEEQSILKRLGGAAGYEHVAFAVDDRLTGQHLGTVGLHDVRPEARTAEVGIFLGAKERWGEGIGYDAMVTLLRFAFWEMNLRVVELSVLEGNERAKALYERVGFVEVGRRPGHWYKHGGPVADYVMSVDRASFEARHGAPGRIALPARGA